jgi:tetratricopeptide (TPR) repeat protein
MNAASLDPPPPDPRQAGVLVEKALVLRRQGDTSGSATLLEQACAVYPAHLNIRLELARDLRALNRLTEAEAAVEAVLKAEPNHIWALVELGHVRRRGGDLATSVDLFRQATILDPTNLNVKTELARDLRGLGRAAEANIVLGEIFAISPGHVWARVEQGHERRTAGDLAGAAAAFEQAAAGAPDNLDIRMEMARDLRALGRLEGAIQALDAVLKSEPSHFPALMEMGHLRRNQGDGDRAVDFFAAAVRANPSHAGARTALAWDLRQLGRLDEAIAHLHDLVALSPADSAAHLALGQTLLADPRQLDAAKTALQRALTIDPNNAQVCVALGQLARRQGDRAVAAGHFERAADVDPQNLDIKLEWATDLREIGLIEDAGALIDGVLAADPGHWNGRMQLGLFRRTIGDRTGALEAFGQASALRPLAIVCAVEMAREYWALGEQTLAVEGLRRAHALQMRSANDWASLGFAWLEFGWFDECRSLVQELKAFVGAPDRSGPYREALDSLEWRLTSLVSWKEVTPSSLSKDNFAGINLIACAYLALNEYERAFFAAQRGVESQGRHPWFMVLSGLALEGASNLAQSLHWFESAVDVSPGNANYQLHLHRLQSKMRLSDAASRTAARLIKDHPQIPAVQTLVAEKQPEQAKTFREDAAPPVTSASKRRTWLHGGDSGDLIYAMAAMSAAGGGHLYLTCFPRTREPMNEAKIAFLAPLLTAQSYIDGVTEWRGEPVGRDFLTMWHLMRPNVDLATQQWCYVIDDTPPNVTAPWLGAPGAVKHGRPVFARSSRYRNPHWEPFWDELKASSPEALFVGTAAEFEDFGHGEHYFARDALDLAQVIAGSSIFVGNQSLSYAIAEGLKVTRILEVSPLVPNCIFPGALALEWRRRFSPEPLSWPHPLSRDGSLLPPLPS